MEWTDEGMIVGVRPHGESAAIVEVLTREHGRHAGVVHGGASRKKAPILQPGNQVEVEWRARLEEHLGSYRVELLQSRTTLLSDRRALAALSAMCGLVCFAMPERMDLRTVYDDTQALVGALQNDVPGWDRLYALWELHLLEALGYGLDLRRCAATGGTEDLIWVSPNSGRAVSRDAGQPYADRLLPLPGFLRGQEEGDALDALTTTGYFLEHWVAPALGDRPLPGARARLIGALRRARASEGRT